MDIEASKNYNNLEESYEDFIEAEDDDNQADEEKTIQKKYITDEFGNVMIYDSEIDNNEENYNEIDEFDDISKFDSSERVNLEERYEDEGYSLEQNNSRVSDEDDDYDDYDEGYKNGYERGAMDAIKAAFRAGFRYGIRRSRYSK